MLERSLWILAKAVTLQAEQVLALLGMETMGIVRGPGERIVIRQPFA